MGISSKKQKTTGSSTSNNTSMATTSNEVPDWIKNPAMANASNIGSIISQGPGAYAPQVSDLQQKAFDAAGGLKNSAFFGQAGDVLNGVGEGAYKPVQGASVLDGGLERYYNPFKDQVLNPALSDYDFQSGQTRA